MIHRLISRFSSCDLRDGVIKFGPFFGVQQLCVEHIDELMMAEC